MAFVDKLKKVTNEAANSVGKFASNVADSSKKMAEKQKLKSKIRNEESIINGIYLTLGKICFESNGEASKEAYEQHIADIKTHLAEIESLNARIAAVDGVGVCSKCGAQLGSSVKFCSACGTPNANYVAPEEKKEETEAPVEAEPVEHSEDSDADVYVDVDSEEEN